MEGGRGIKMGSIQEEEAESFALGGSSRDKFPSGLGVAVTGLDSFSCSCS